MEKVIFITGTSRGIGRALQEHFQTAGHIVYGSSRKGDEKDPYHLKLDVTDAASCEMAVDEVMQNEGRIDVLINNAGFHLTGASEETGLEEIRAQMDINFYGAIYMIKAVTPILIKQKSGRIINMSSLGGLLALPFTSAYNASKFALEGYTESLRMELLPLGIYVSNIEAPYINTGTVDQSIGGPMKRDAILGPYREAMHEKMHRDSVKGVKMATVVRTFGRIVTAEKPKFRYKLSSMTYSLLLFQFLLPQKLFERMVLRSFRIPGKMAY